MYFASIDAHAKLLRLAVLDKAAVLVHEQEIPCEPEQLRTALAPYRPLRVVVETCPFWPWIADALQGPGVDFRLAHATKLRAIATSAQKNDRVDARLLGRMLHSDLIPFAYPRTPEERETLRLLRHRAALVRTRSALAARIHSQLHQANLVLPREALLRRRTRTWLREVAEPQLTPEQRRLLQTHLVLIDTLQPLLRQLEREIRRRGQDDPLGGLLRTVPGIGRFWALLLAAELRPLARYADAAHFVSYCGLVPITRSSAGHTHHGSLPAAANRWVRWALISAVAKHVKLAPASPVSRYYERQVARLGWKKARVAAARKLAGILYHMLRRQQAWRG